MERSRAAELATAAHPVLADGPAVLTLLETVTTALVARGRREQAAAELVKLARACALKNWAFTEWLHGKTYAPRGMLGQSWNAAATPPNPKTKSCCCLFVGQASACHSRRRSSPLPSTQMWRTLQRAASTLVSTSTNPTHP